MGLSWPGCYAPHRYKPEQFSFPPSATSSISDLFHDLWSLLSVLAFMHVSLAASWVWQSVLLLSFFLPTICFVARPPPFWRRTTRRVVRLLWRTKKPFRRRRLPYHLVIRCCRRAGNQPPKLCPLCGKATVPSLGPPKALGDSVGCCTACAPSSLMCASSPPSASCPSERLRPRKHSRWRRRWRRVLFVLFCITRSTPSPSAL